MKNLIFGTILFISGFIYGVSIYKYNLFPIKYLKQIKNYVLPNSEQFQLPDDVYFIPYTLGIPLFSDRAYFDTVGDSALESTYVLQIPRHLNSSIQIKILRPIIIYRFLTDKNDNSEFNDWELSSIKVNVPGRSCTFNNLVSKLFYPGNITLPSGGPKAASPIIIRDLSHKPVSFPINIINSKKESLKINPRE